MPRVSQAHLDARRQQIVGAARARFASHGFAHTSMADIIAESGLSNGAIYRYFTSKEEIVIAVCEQGTDVLPRALTAEAVSGFLDHVRTLARDANHARLIAQIYAEAAYAPTLAAMIQEQWAVARSAIADLVRAERPEADAEGTAEAFLTVLHGFNLQLAVRGDLGTASAAQALLAIVGAPPKAG